MFTKFLIPLDNSVVSEQALPTAESLARAAHASIELVYVHTPQPGDGCADIPANAARRSSEDSYIRGIADEMRSGAGLTIDAGIATGKPADAICARAARVGADIIVMTTHGRTGISRAWMGSVADGVVKQATVPVLLLRAAEAMLPNQASRARTKRVLVALDGSAASESILEPAAAFAGLDQGRLIVIEIVTPMPLFVPDLTLSYTMGPKIADPVALEQQICDASRRLHAIVQRFAEQGFSSVETHVKVSDFPAQAILDASRAHGADVIAMTTSGRGASRLVVGSVTDKVMRASSLPLLLQRPIGVGRPPLAAVPHELADMVSA